MIVQTNANVCDIRCNEYLNSDKTTKYNEYLKCEKGKYFQTKEDYVIML